MKWIFERNLWTTKIDTRGIRKAEQSNNKGKQKNITK